MWSIGTFMAECHDRGKPSTKHYVKEKNKENVEKNIDNING